MTLAKLVVLANLDVDGGPAPEPSVASLLVVLSPQVAGLQIGDLSRLSASGADKRCCGTGQAVSPAVRERKANRAQASQTAAGWVSVVGNQVGQKTLHRASVYREDELQSLPWKHERQCTSSL